MTTEDEIGRAGENSRAIARNLAKTGPANHVQLDRVLRMRRVGGISLGSDNNLSLIIRRADNYLNKPLETITADDGLRVMEHLKSFPGQKGRPACAKVVHLRSVVFRYYLKEVMGLDPKRDKLPRDLDRATYVPKPKEPEESGVALTDAQFRRLVDAGVRLWRGREAARKATEFSTILWTKWDGWPRIGELLSLSIEEVELRSENAGMLHVREPRWGNRLKTGPRVIPITACVPMLRLWLERHPARDDPKAPLFHAFGDRTGKRPLRYNDFYWKVRAAAQLSGVDRELPPGVTLSPHDLRHTGATNEAAAGDAALRKKGGWSKRSAMPGHYTSHLTADRVLVQMQELTIKRFGLPTVRVGAAPLYGTPTPPVRTPEKAPALALQANLLTSGGLEEQFLDALMARVATKLGTRQPGVTA